MLQAHKIESTNYFSYIVHSLLKFTYFLLLMYCYFLVPVSIVNAKNGLVFS